RGSWPATCSLVQSFMKETIRRDSGAVEAARWLTAAVARSPPQESSMLTISPSCSPTSLSSRAAVRPPTRLSLRLTPASAPASQVARRQSRGLAEHVPARDVQRALRVRVAAQGGVHGPVDRPDVRRVEPEHGGRELAQRREGSRRVGRQVARAERAGLAVP